MKRNKTLKARKETKQDRAQATLDAIVESATILLSEFGFEKTNTNKISERAGVSIGSYYQYFPNKESLIAKIIEQEITKQALTIEKMINESKNENLNYLIDLLVDYLGEQFFRRHKLAGVLIGLMGQLKRVKVQMEARGRLVNLLQSVFEERRSEMSIAEPKQAAYIVVHSYMGVLYMASLDGSIKTDYKQINDSLKTMIKKFLLN